MTQPKQSSKCIFTGKIFQKISAILKSFSIGRENYLKEEKNINETENV